LFVLIIFLIIYYNIYPFEQRKGKGKKLKPKANKCDIQTFTFMGPSFHSIKNIAQFFSLICASFAFRTHAMHDGCAATSVPAVVSSPLPLLGAN